MNMDEYNLAIEIASINEMIDVNSLYKAAELFSRQSVMSLHKVLYECRKTILSGMDFFKTDIGKIYLRNLKGSENMSKVKYERMYDEVRKQRLKIKKVIFNDPATIVLWEDGTKTVVKVQEGEIFDPEKGLAMAISKKALGNEGNYYNEIGKWVKGLL